MSIGDTVKSVGSAAPIGYLGAWIVGIPVEKWAAFAALVWSLGLMWTNWLWKPWLKPKWQHRKARKHGRA